MQGNNMKFIYGMLCSRKSVVQIKHEQISHFDKTVKQLCDL